MTSNGTLYLVPTPLGNYIPSFFNDPYYIEIIASCRHFIVEEIKTTRRFLRKIIPQFPIDDCQFLAFNEHSLKHHLTLFIEPLKKGFNVCMLSEAGCPAIADPGYPIILEAHRQKIKVSPLIGPSSILLALMASGLPAQQFKFNGYLPVKTDELRNKLKILERQSLHENLSQVFIETPYRNQSIFNELIQSCQPTTLLCIASNITQPDEFIKTQSISHWHKNSWIAEKNPTIFILYSGKL